MKNNLKKLFGLVICSILIPICFMSCKKNDKTEIVIYSCETDYCNAFYLSELEKQFPDISFILDYQSSGTSAAKLKVEGENTGADILLSWDTAYLDVLTEYLADLSYFDYSIFIDSMDVPSKKYVVSLINSGCVAINKDVINGLGLPEPTSYKDLLKPDYKNLISMPNPKTSGTGYIFLKNLVNAWGEDEAFNYFDDLSSNILQYSTSGEGSINALLQKEVAVALGMTAQAVTVINQGIPLKILNFEEGMPCNLYGHAMTRKAEKREDYDKVQEVFDYLVNVVTPACDALYYPEKLFKDIDANVPNYPTNIKYADMSNNSSEEKQRLLDKWNH